MPVWKYRSVDELPPPDRSDDASLLMRIRALWTRANVLCPVSPRRGVLRFRTIQEANDDRQRAVRERMKRLAG